MVNALVVLVYLFGTILFGAYLARFIKDVIALTFVVTLYLM